MLKHNYLIDKFNVNESLDLVDLLIEYKNIDEILIENLEIDGKTFSIYKKMDNLIINSSDGRVMCISLTPSETYEKDHRDISVVSVEYPNDEHKVLFSSIMSVRGNKINKDEFLDSVIFAVENNKDKNNLLIKRYGPDGIVEAETSLSSKEPLNTKLIFFGGYGIFYDGIRMSEDGKKVIEYKGKEVPEQEVLSSFDSEKEKEKLLQVLGNNNGYLHQFTVEEIEKVVKRLDARKEYLEELSKTEEDMSSQCQKLLASKRIFENGIESLFSKREIVGLVSELTSIFNYEMFNQETYDQRKLSKVPNKNTNKEN